MFTVYQKGARVNSKNNHKLNGQEYDRSTILIFWETAMLYTTLIRITADRSRWRRKLHAFHKARFVCTFETRNTSKKNPDELTRPADDRSWIITQSSHPVSAAWHND
jgi:hypothetical protein